MAPPVIAKFSLFALSRRSISHHARSYIFALLSAAMATAVITGALLVGDSVEGSLEDRLLERLGRVDHVLVSGTFFRDELASDLVKDLEGAANIHLAAPLLLLSGSVRHADSDRMAAEVNVFGVPASFWEFWKAPGPPAGIRGPEGRRAFVNAELAAALGAHPGDAILLHVEKRSDVPPEHALGRRGASGKPMRLELGQVLPDQGLALFDLRNSQRTPRNVFVPREELERALEKKGLVNALLVSSKNGSPEGKLDAILRRAWKLDDAGLRLDLRAEKGYAALESRELLLPPEVVSAARLAAAAAGAQSRGVLTYLANTISLRNREIPYSTITAAEPWLPASVPPEGDEVLPGAGGIVLNDWAASDLQAEVGDPVRIKYYAVGDDHQLEERAAELTLRRILPIQGEAADPGWTPRYPGISDSRRLRDWDPPFPVDLKRIRDKDESYWDAYRATPKAFISAQDGRRLWSSRFGELTSIRIRSGDASRKLQEVAEPFRAKLLQTLDPVLLGLSFRAVKEEGLRAARSGTDFGVLFLSFSFFVIVSALLLVAMTFRLACQRRVKELGIVVAVGFSPGDVMRMLFLDGAWVVLGGGLAGTFGGAGYAALLIAGLRKWWSDAVSAPFLAFHGSARSLAIGFGLIALLGSLTVFLVSMKISGLPPRRLLGGAGLPLEERLGGGARRGRRSLWFAAGAGALSAMFLLAGALGASLDPAVAFFGAGAALFAAGLALVSWLLRRVPRKIARGKGLAALCLMGAHYGGRSPGRSLLTVALISSATFIIVTVSGSARLEGDSLPAKSSGNGGFSLLARAAVPLTASLSSAEGRDALNLAGDTTALLDRSKVYAFRVRSGDDASCLNLYRPQSPRILGAPRSFLSRGGFAWQESAAASGPERENPWLLLEKELLDGAIPAVGDFSTVTWILHSGLGKDFTVPGEGGRPLKLRWVGLLSHSLFQGEVLISEREFLKAFPRAWGERCFLLETAPGDADALARGLEKDLAEYGLDVEPAGKVIASYQAVENTYLSTFQVLGGLGLLLGTLGLGAVLLRNVNERRGELALLRAVGYTSGALASIVLGETVFLLGIGLLVGAGSAVLAVLPSAARGGAVSWAGLLAMLAAVFAAGLLSATAALRAVLRAPLLPALRTE